MIKKITAISILLITSLSASTQSIEKTLYKKIQPEFQSILSVGLNHSVRVEKWNRDFIRIETKVVFSGASAPVLKGLIVGGRYAIQSTFEKSTIQVRAANLEKTLFYKGGELTEEISYRIYVPTTMKVILEESDLVIF